LRRRTWGRESFFFHGILLEEFAERSDFEQAKDQPGLE